MKPEDKDLLSRCVVDTIQRRIYLYSEEGRERVVNCDTVDEFMNVLRVVRDKCPEDQLSYSDPL